MPRYKKEKVYDAYCAWPYAEPYGIVEVRVPVVPKKPRKRRLLSVSDILRLPTPKTSTPRNRQGEPRA